MATRKADVNMTDADGVDHFPSRLGGPSFATVCGADGEPWPCTAGEKLGAEPIEPTAGTVDTSDPVAIIDGNTAASIVSPGELPDWATRPEKGD
jgi:hypothetical protein